MGACLQDSVYHPLLRFDNGDPVTNTPAQRWVQYCDLMKQPHEWVMRLVLLLHAITIITHSQ